MLSLEEAQAAILAAIRPGGDTESVATEHAYGRYCAQPLRARVDHPAFDNSSMDGYAVNAADARAHGFILPVIGTSSCGEAPQTLAPGTAMRIFTGAPLPLGADTIVIQEDVTLSAGNVRLPPALAIDQDVRRRGEDYRAGETLYTPGRRLGAPDIALLCAAGIEHVPVYRRPRALIAATGNELVALGRALGPGQIYESNRVAVSLQLRALGVDVTDGGIVRDELAALRALLAQAGAYDFVITSGGASVGEHDLIKQAFAEIGTLQLWKVSIKPGKPIAFGHIGARTHFFALPGNPVSSLVTYKLFVEPALGAWHHAAPQHWQLTAVADNSFERRPGRTEFLRARLHSENGRLHAEVLRGQGSHMIGTLRHTNGFIRVEAQSSGFAAGDSVIALPL